MQRNLLITHEAHSAIRAKAEGGWRETGTRQPDGQWLVPFDEEVIGRMEKLALPGETHSETIVRICALHGTKPN